MSTLRKRLMKIAAENNINEEDNSVENPVEQNEEVMQDDNQGQLNEKLFEKLVNGEIEIRSDVVSFVFNSLKLDVFEDGKEVEVSGNMPFADFESKFGEIQDIDLNQLNDSSENEYGIVSQEIENMLKDSSNFSKVEFDYSLTFTRDIIRLESKGKEVVEEKNEEKK